MTNLRFALAGTVSAVCMALVTQTATAQGACPSGLANDGVYVSYADRVVRYERLSTGLTAEFETAFDGSFVYGYRTHPIGLVETSWELQGGRIVAGSFETVQLEGAALPQPAPGMTWNGIETSRFTDGSVTTFQTSVLVEDMDVLEIGGCQYSGLPITVTRINQSDGVTSQDAFGYFPDLGVVMFLGFGDGIDNVSFDLPVAISDLPPNADGSGPVLDTK